MILKVGDEIKVKVKKTKVPINLKRLVRKITETPHPSGSRLNLKTSRGE